MTRSTDEADPLLQSASRQLLIGIVLLVVGIALAAWLVSREATVGSAIGYVIAIAGLVMIGWSLRIRARSRR